MIDDVRKITAGTPEEAWEQIRSDLEKDPDLLQYRAQATFGGTLLTLVIDIDPGGGFESGISYTTLSSDLPAETGFRFAIHNQHFIDEVGKFFGMQDIETGFTEFDKKIIVKSDDPARVRVLFANEAVRKTLVSLHNFSLFTEKGSSDIQLVLMIDDGITDPEILGGIFRAFIAVLGELNH